MVQNTNGRRARGPVNDPKTGKFANAGAAAGGFVGALGGSMVPPINVTVKQQARGQLERAPAARRSPAPRSGLLLARAGAELLQHAAGGGRDAVD
jgi:hypothetical protein